MANRGGGAIWIFVILGVVALMVFGVIPDPTQWFADTGEPSDGGEPGIIPSSGLCTLTLKTRDALSSTETNVNVTYYIFTADGSVKKTSTTSAGTKDIDLDYSATSPYKIVAYDDDGTAPDFYWNDEILMQGESSASSEFYCNAATKTGWMYLTKETPVNSTKLRDPVDFDSNISLPAGGSASFDILLKTSGSYAGTRKPAVVFDVNTTSIDTISCSGGTIMGSTPSRLTTTSGYKKIGINLNRDYITSSDSTVIYSCTITSLSGTTPSTEDYITVTTIDETFFKPAVANNLADFLEDYQNTETQADIGEIDGGCSRASEHQEVATCQLYFNG